MTQWVQYNAIYSFVLRNIYTIKDRIANIIHILSELQALKLDNRFLFA